MRGWLSHNTQPNLPLASSYVPCTLPAHTHMQYYMTRVCYRWGELYLATQMRGWGHACPLWSCFIHLVSRFQLAWPGLGWPTNQIHVAHNRSPGIWLWNVYTTLPGLSCHPQWQTYCPNIYYTRSSSSQQLVELALFIQRMGPWRGNGGCYKHCTMSSFPQLWWEKKKLWESPSLQKDQGITFCSRAMIVIA